MVPKGIRRKMVLLLIIMTPGIPEYMTGSSRLGPLVSDPFSFLLELGFNIALYSAGALLIREFSIRYNKGWGSILLLGLVYGIMEEGISVHTFFIPSGNPVGILAMYGRYLGVDWIWALGISVFHAVFSIGLPILLLAIAYPKYAREPLLRKRSSSLVIGFYAVDVIVLNLVVNAAKPDAIPTGGQYIFFLLLSLILILSARFLPGSWLAGHGKPDQGARKFFLLGMLAFPLYAANAFLPAAPDGTPRISPVLDAAFYIFANVALMLAISRFMPPVRNRRHKFALALGLITPLFVWAEVVQLIGLAQLITIVSIIGIAFLIRLRKWVKTGANMPELDMTQVTVPQ